GRSARRRVHEVGVARAVGRLDHDLRFGDRDGTGHGRQHHCDAGPEQDTELTARHQPALLVDLGVFSKVVLVAHGELLSAALKGPLYWFFFFTPVLRNSFLELMPMSLPR